MTPEEMYEAIAAALRRLDRAQRTQEREVGALRQQMDSLIELLVGRELLGEGHRRHLARVARAADGTPEPKVRLRQYVDKYDLADGEPIDCEARLHLCKARCCSYRVELTTQDLDEGKLRWDVQDPYVLRRDAADGYCGYLDRERFVCTTYETRPATCRQYSCRDDRRIWIDFEKRIPAAPPLTAEE